MPESLRADIELRELTQSVGCRGNLTFALAAFLNILLGFRSALGAIRVTHGAYTRAKPAAAD